MHSTANRVTVQADPGRAFRPARGRNARAYSPETQYPPRCARRVLPRLRPGRRRVQPRGLRPLGTVFRVRRGLHGPCCVLPSVGHGPRQPLRGRRGPPASMPQRASHPPALRAVATIPAQPWSVYAYAPARLRRAYAIPRAPRLAWPVLRPPFGRARATPAATWSAMSTGLDAATRFPSSGASRRRYHPRATVVGHADGPSPFPPDPALACLLRRRAAGPPTPHAVSLSRPRFIEPRRPSPASPAGSAPEPLA